jgi:hypothetical protein
LQKRILDTKAEREAKKKFAVTDAAGQAVDDINKA